MIKSDGEIVDDLPVTTGSKSRTATASTTTLRMAGLLIFNSLSKPIKNTNKIITIITFSK